MSFSKVLTFTIGAVFLCGSSFAQDNLINKVKSNYSSESAKHFKFKEIINLEHFPVQNQGRSGTCWSYATNSFLESEMVRAGKTPVELSKMFTARNAYIEKGKQYVRMEGAVMLGDGGEAHDVINMYRKYGAVPQEAYVGLNYGTKINDFSQMSSLREAFLKEVVAMKKNNGLQANWLKAYTGLIDAYLGTPPEKFTWNGKEYTPKTFADEVVGINPDDYVEITSFIDWPLYKTFVMPVPDNWAYDIVYNVAFDEFTDIIDTALSRGYTVSWGTDVSERYFSWKNGVAYVPEKEFADMDKTERENMFKGPKPEREITAEMRQEAFDALLTTDDHGMQIIGLAKDLKGREYYIVKNSWGDKNDHGGYLYVTKTFVRFKTTDFMVNKNALTQEMRSKLGI